MLFYYYTHFGKYILRTLKQPLLKKTYRLVM